MAKSEESTATVKRAKQDDLPTITPSDRKIQELEDLGDDLIALEDKMSVLKEKVKEANENLVAAMKRREKTYYNRQTWGSILITEPGTVKAKVKKASAGGGEADE